MKSLVIVAHGSRRQASNDEVRDLSSRIENITGQQFRKVKAAFLELAEPSIPNGIQQCIDEGAEEIVVFPYFLSAGRHVVEDIPSEIDIARKSNPEIKIEIAPYLGSMDGIVDLIAAQTTAD